MDPVKYHELEISSVKYQPKKRSYHQYFPFFLGSLTKGGISALSNGQSDQGGGDLIDPDPHSMARGNLNKSKKKVLISTATTGKLIYTCKIIKPGIFSRFSQPVYFSRL